MNIIVSSGQTVTSQMLSRGTVMVVESGGKAVATTARNASINLSFGGIIKDTILEKGGETAVLGEAISTTVSGGGEQNVFSGGLAIGTFVRQNGKEFVYSSAVARGSIVSGQQIVAGGVAKGTVVLSHGEAIAQGGGTLLATSINAHGLEIVNNGGTSVDTIVTARGFAGVFSGGVASDITVEKGGAIEIAQGGTETGLTLAAGGTLELPGMTFVSGGTATVSGHFLTISEGGVTSTLSLKGGYANATFYLSKELDGGTDVTLSYKETAGALLPLVKFAPTSASVGAEPADLKSSPPGAASAFDRSEARPTGMLPFIIRHQ